MFGMDCKYFLVCSIYNIDGVSRGRDGGVGGGGGRPREAVVFRRTENFSISSEDIQAG